MNAYNAPAAKRKKTGGGSGGKGGKGKTGGGGGVVFPDATAPPECADPATQFGGDCSCFEDDTAYFGNNRVVGSENPQPSRSACRRSCAEHAECAYWTWGKGTPTGPCYLKTSRDGVTHGMTDYVSGTKGCLLPEDKGRSLSWRCRADLILTPWSSK